MLLAAGADPLFTSDDGTTPLMVAAGLGRYTNDKNLRRGELKPSAEKAVRLLLAAGSDINARNEADFTALHGAALRGSHEVIQILVDHGADLNARDFRGRTPYRLAEGSKQAFYFQEFPRPRHSWRAWAPTPPSVSRGRCRSACATRRPRPPSPSSNSRSSSVRIRTIDHAQEP